MNKSIRVMFDSSFALSVPLHLLTPCLLLLRCCLLQPHVLQLPLRWNPFGPLPQKTSIYRNFCTLQRWLLLQLPRA